MIVEGNKILAESGKYLFRVSDSMFAGKEYFLGYLHYLGGVRLQDPILEKPSDFEELPYDKAYSVLVDMSIRQRYTISEELAIQRQRDSKPEKFQEYFNFCEDCKVRAKEELGL